MNMNWNASTDNVGVTGYQVYRATSNGGAGTLVATAPSTNYVDPGLGDGTYWYYLRAVDAAGNQSWRTGYKSVTVGGQVADTQRPSAPTGLMVTSVSNNSASLLWNPSTDNVGVTEYRVFDAATNAIVATSPTNTIALPGLTPGTAYSFYVKAADAAENQSWRSNIVSLTTNP